MVVIGVALKGNGSVFMCGLGLRYLTVFLFCFVFKGTKANFTYSERHRSTLYNLMSFYKCIYRHKYSLMAVKYRLIFKY